MTTTERSLFVVTNYRRPDESKHRLRREPPILGRVQAWVIGHAQYPFEVLTRRARRLARQVIAYRLSGRAARRRAKQQRNEQRIQHLAALQLQQRQ